MPARLPDSWSSALFRTSQSLLFLRFDEWIQFCSEKDSYHSLWSLHLLNGMKMVLKGSIPDLFRNTWMRTRPLRERNVSDFTLQTCLRAKLLPLTFLWTRAAVSGGKGPTSNKWPSFQTSNKLPSFQMEEERGNQSWARSWQVWAPVQVLSSSSS